MDIRNFVGHIHRTKAFPKMIAPKHLLGGCALVGILLGLSCRKDPTTPEYQVPVQRLKLTVRPTWNGFPFRKDSIYAAAGGQRVKVDELKFYLSPLTLRSDGDSLVEMSAVELFQVVNGPEERLYLVPQGHYGTMGLGLGLPPALNHRDLSTIPPNAPTGNNSGMYWEWATMYKFAIWSGKFDSDPGGQGEPPFPFDLHTGLDTCYRRRTIPIALEVNATDTARLTLDVDIARFFTDGSQVLNLSQGAMWHGNPDEIGLALKVSGLQAAALSVAP